MYAKLFASHVSSLYKQTRGGSMLDFFIKLLEKEPQIG